MEGCRRTDCTYNAGMKAFGSLCLVLLFTTSVDGGEADVLEAKATCTEERVCRFEVTVRHADDGWDHYANRWEIVDADGEILAVRELAHPHVNEQPFTRSLDGVKILDGIDEVKVRAHDSVHGYGGAEVEVRIATTGT